MTKTESLRPEVVRFRRRLVALLFLDRALKALALAGFSWGVLVLALRVGFDVPRPALLGGFAAVAASALGAALRQSLRARPTLSCVGALLDRHQGHGGLLMAASETEIGPWRPEARHSEPRLVWHSRSAWTLAAGSAAFLAVAFLVPTPTVEASVSRPLDLGEELEELAESFDVLEAEELLSGEEAERLEFELETLVEEASGEDPARAWETLDQLRETAEQTAREAAEAALTEGEQLAAALDLAQALEENTGSSDVQAAALEDLAELSARAAEESRLLDRELTEALGDVADSGDLGALRAALGEARSGAEAKLDRLHEAGLIDLGTLIEAKKALGAGDEALADFLAESGFEAAAAYCRRPGAGGVTRGRGDAAMSWGEEASREGTSFEEQVLDPASLAALEKNALLGLRAVDPTSGGRRPLPSPEGSVLDGASAGGGGAHTQTVLPRHRRAVERFFARGEEATPPPRQP